MADELERDRPFSRVSAENESELLDCDDTIFLTSSDSAASALLGYAQEEHEMFEGEEVETEPSQSSCTAYERVFGGSYFRILEGMRDNGYEGMPPVQEMITLSLCGETSSLKAPSWPSKPLNLA